MVWKNFFCYRKYVNNNLFSQMDKSGSRLTFSSTCARSKDPLSSALRAAARLNKPVFFRKFNASNLELLAVKSCERGA
jgi:hypothetical protein